MVVLKRTLYLVNIIFIIILVTCCFDKKNNKNEEDTANSTVDIENEIDEDEEDLEEYPIKPLTSAPYRADKQNTGLFETAALKKDPIVKWKFKSNSDIYSSPFIENGKIYFGAMQNGLYCLDIETGKTIWNFADVGVEAPPEISDAVYFGGSDYNLYAVNKNNGDFIWKIKTVGSIDSSSRVIDGIIYYSDISAFSYALRLSDKKELWRLSFGRKNYIDSTIANYNNNVYFGCGDNNIYAVEKNTGEIIWQYTTGHSISGDVAISDGIVYASSYDKYVYALDANDGNLIWKKRMNGYSNSSPAIAYGLLFYGNKVNYLYAFDSKTGEIQWKYRAGNQIMSSPSVAEGIIYFGCQDGNFYALSAKTGKEKWIFNAEYPIKTSPVILDGIVYFGTTGYGEAEEPTEGHYFYALEEGE